MAYNVHFAKGSQLSYNSLATKDPGTLYFITDAENPAFYLGTQKLSSLAEVATLVSRCDGEDQEIAAIKSALRGIDLTKESSVLTVIQNTAADIRDDIGEVSDLNTVSQTVVEAVNEVLSTVEQNKTDGTLSIIVNDEPTGLLRTYTVKQGTDTIGIINIPKDLVVQSGRVIEVVADEEELGKWVVKGSPTNEEIISASVAKAGTYMELRIRNQETDEPVYIDVQHLVDIYTAQQNATQVQLSVIGTEISAVIVQQSITSRELATDSVITVKIADKNVTKAKLEQSVQDSLDLADTSVQTISEGLVNYSIDVDGEPVRVHGLGSAALQDEDYFDLKNSAANVLGLPSDSADAMTVYGAHAHATLAESNANTYTDNALTWGSIGNATQTPATPTPSDDYTGYPNTLLTQLGASAYASTFSDYISATLAQDEGSITLTGDGVSAIVFTLDANKTTATYTDESGEEQNTTYQVDYTTGTVTVTNSPKSSQEPSEPEPSEP